MQRSEQETQRAVLDHLRMRGNRGLVYFAVPNGGYRSSVEAGIMKGLGVRAGVSDLILLYSGAFYAMELKSDKGKATLPQAAFLAEVRAAGGHTAVCGSLDAAIERLESWGLIRGKAQ
jgi:hypothetical protein